MIQFLARIQIVFAKRPSDSFTVYAVLTISMFYLLLSIYGLWPIIWCLPLLCNCPFFLTFCLCDSLSLPSLSYTPSLYPSIHPGALQIEMSEESDQGKYECVATNSDGTRYSTPANLYVRGKRGKKTRLSCEHQIPIRVLRFKEHIVNVWANWDLEAFLHQRVLLGMCVYHINVIWRLNLLCFILLCSRDINQDGFKKRARLHQFRRDCMFHSGY